VRFLKDEFTCEYDPTIEENYRKNVTVDNTACTAYIIDTAGQVFFANMSTNIRPFATSISRKEKDS
jgi:GTPase SAR1 family protein